MAFVPDEAVCRSAELSPKAFVLFVTYCKYRNAAGTAWPCLATLSAQLGVQKAAACKLRKELVNKGWISLSGDVATLLTGFTQKPKDQDSKTGRFHHGNIVSSQETVRFPHGNEISTTETERFHPGNESFPSGKSHIRKNQPMEPAQRTRESETAVATSPRAHARELLEKLSPTAYTLAEICNYHPDLLTTKDTLELEHVARLLDQAGGFSRDELRWFPDYWEGKLRKRAPLRPAYVPEHFGNFLAWRESG